MRKVTVLLAGVTFVLALLTNIAFAADKFAYVDLSRIFSEYHKTKTYDKVLSDKQGVYETERDKRVNELKQLKEKVDLLSEKEKSLKKPDLDTRMQSFQEFDRQKQTDLRKEQDEKMREILKDIEEVIKQYGAKEGYTMIFNDRVLVYQVKSMDITDKIIEIINKGEKK